ncbi:MULTISPECIES: hypothetical protein [Thermocrispum]|jgi:hypothetical protein|uniref:MFS transporter n=1 Tax=Thermocrispum agreste TaxID=37925 RepID=A0ABD6FD75_9PSEU|nr:MULTISPECIES: hypothetical protein [Thermocrispum]
MRPPIQPEPPRCEPEPEAVSGWSGITAGVLAAVLGCGGLVLSVLGLLAVWDDAQLHPAGVVVYLILVGITVALLSGSVLLLRRRQSGQITVAAATAAALSGLGYVLIAGTDRARDSAWSWQDDPAVVTQLQWLVGVWLVVVVVTLVLTLLPATGRWCSRGASQDEW